MANATLYKNQSDENVMKKTLTALSSASIVLKDMTNVVNPTITMSYNANVDSCNYIYIDIFNRYYFVRDKQVGEQRVIISLDADDLYNASIRGIGNCKAIAERSANRFNNFLADDRITTLQYDDYYIKKFSGHFNKTLSYVLVLAGGV